MFEKNKTKKQLRPRPTQFLELDVRTCRPIQNLNIKRIKISPQNKWDTLNI